MLLEQSISVSKNSAWCMAMVDLDCWELDLILSSKIPHISIKIFNKNSQDWYIATFQNRIKSNRHKILNNKQGYNALPCKIY